jgi:hypothetical protein
MAQPRLLAGVPDVSCPSRGQREQGRAEEERSDRHIAPGRRRPGRYRIVYPSGHRLPDVVGTFTILPIPEGSQTPMLFLPDQTSVLAFDPRARIHDLLTGECIYDGRAECPNG